MSYSTIATILGTAALGFTSRLGSFGKRKYNIFNPDIYAIGKQLQKANEGLSNGTLNGVELCGDSMKLWRTLKNKSIQTIITSPPYFSMRDYSTSHLEIGNRKTQHKSIKGELTGEEYVQQLVEMFLNLKDKLKDNGTIVVNIDVGAAKWTNHLEHIPALFQTRMVETGEFLLDQWLTIHKENYRPDITSPVRANPNTEMLLVFTKSENVDGKKRRPSHKKWNTLWDTSFNPPRIIGKTIVSERAQIKLWNSRKTSGTKAFMKRFPDQTGILSILTGGNWSHLAPMNKELTWKLIQLFSDPGDVVLDPFSGAGNTTKAAKICGRIGIGFELNKMYSMTAVIGEEWQSAPLQRLSEKYRLPNPKNPRSNDLKGLKKIPFCDPGEYEPNKTMWIDLSYLNLS